MRNRSILPLLLAALVVLVLVAFGGAGLLGQQAERTTPETASSPTSTAGGPATSAAAKQQSPPQRSDNPSSLPEIRESALPAEGLRVLVLIRAGGPFRYSQDDQVFGNFERVLPVRNRGYYREYTVPTPGEADRGARRIVAGDGGEKYYTSDHYATFKYIAEGN